MANVNVAHMCRDGHVEIYYNDSSHELCPLCRCQNALREALGTWDVLLTGAAKPLIFEHRKRISELRKFLDDK